MIRVASTCVLFSLLALCPASVQGQQGQRKPDAPEAKPDHTPRWAVSDEFLDAYRKLGSPRLLFLWHANVATFGGEDYTNELAIPRAFEARLANAFQHPDVLIRSVWLTDADKEASALVLRDPLGAVKLLGDQAQADYSIIFVFTERLPGDAGGARYGLVYSVHDMNRSQLLDSWSWDFKSDPDDNSYSTKWIGKTVKEAARRIQDRLILRSQHGAGEDAKRYWTVLVQGVGARDTAALESAVKSVSGVELRQFDIDQGVARLSVQHPGPAVKLANALRAACAHGMGLALTYAGAREGTITLQAAPERIIGDETLLTGDPAPVGFEQQQKSLLERLTKAYADKGRPKIAVRVNYELEPTTSGPTTAPSTVVIGGVGRDANVGTGQAEAERGRARAERDEFLDARQMENQLYERLGRLNLRLVDKDPADADLLISGSGKVTRQPAADGKSKDISELRYTFKVLSPKGADVLGSATVNFRVETVENAAELMDAVTADAVARLAYQMLKNWEAP